MNVTISEAMFVPVIAETEETNNNAIATKISKLNNFNFLKIFTSTPLNYN